LLGAELWVRDIDLLVEGDALELAKACAAKFGGRVRQFVPFLTAKLLSPNGLPDLREIDFAMARTETYPRPGCLPLVKPASIEEDVWRRDFTVNALMLPSASLVQLPWERERLVGQVVDLVGGIQDLQQRSIRILHPASFVDDPTRIFRACRYAERIGGALESGTERLLRAALACGSLRTISRERVVNEARKILSEQNWGSILCRAGQLGVLSAAGLWRREDELALSGRLARFAESAAEFRGADCLPLFIGTIIGSQGSESLKWLNAFGIKKKLSQALVSKVSGQEPACGLGKDYGVKASAFWRDFSLQWDSFQALDREASQ